MNYAEQIAAYEAKRASSVAAMGLIMSKSAETGESLDAAQQDEFDTLEKDVAAIDGHVERLKKMQTMAAEHAVVVRGASLEEGAAHRAPIIVRAAPIVLPKGIGFTRFVKAMALAKGSASEAYALVKGNDRWCKETPELVDILNPAAYMAIKTAVAAGNTTDATYAGPLVQYQNLASEFVEYLRPLTIVGRLNLRHVPFKVKIPRQTGGASATWVGEGKVKPVTSGAFDSITMDFSKIAGIVVLTEELIRLSDPSAELLVRDDLAKAIVQFMDSQFVDPTKAADDISPASITNGVTDIKATGSDLDALRADVQTLMDTFLDSNLSMGDAVWIMTQQQSLSISMMQNALGQKVYPEMSVNGGIFEGLPVVASENIPGTGGSPTDGYPIILAKQQDILLADDGQVAIDISREASIQMDTTPDSPATTSTVMTSFWQQNLIGIRAERMVRWAKRRSESVGYISYAKYRA